MKIILIGYMGSGKSTIGSELASRLNTNFKDLDHEIELQENTTISKLFAERGVIYFRKTEKNILKTIVESQKSMVLATGGGTPCYGDVMKFLKQEKEVLTIYLRCSIASLSERLFKEKETRPLLAMIATKEELNEFIGKHLFERSQFYNQADLSIKTDGLAVSEVVQTIMDQINQSK